MKLNRYLTPSLLLLPIIIASGCTPYGESFDCPPGHGVGCKSLSHVNRMVEEGELPLERVTLEKPPLERASPKSAFSQQKLMEAHSRVDDSVGKNGPIPLTPSQEAPLKVWMTSYKDEEGILHGPSMLYVNLSDLSRVKP